MSQYSIGISALRTGQRALDLIGQNLTNASTPGYSRQALSLVSRSVDGVTGDGVDISRIVRYSNQQMRNGIFTAESEKQRLAARIDSQQQAETYLTPGDGTLDKRISGFFDQITSLSVRPDDPTQRTLLANTANAVAKEFKSISTNLSTLRTDASRNISQAVSDINLLAPKISELNLQIAKVEATTGAQANDLRDQRDGAIKQLAGLIDIRTQAQENGSVNITAGNAPLVVGETAFKFETVLQSNGNMQVQVANEVPVVFVTPQGGKLGGLLDENNTNLPGYRAKLDTLAQKFIQLIDNVQSTGLGSNGAFSAALGVRGPASATTPLATSGLKLPMQAGDMVISVTNLATQQRSNVTIPIDPATQSLQDISTAINTATGGNVTTSINPGPNTLQFQAASGFAFDFSGRIPSQPTSVAMGGTAVPQVGGTYSGASNDLYTYQVVGSGTVGVTPGLSMQVIDSSSNVLGSFNIGEGYTPNNWIQTNNGIQVKFAAGGTTTAGSFTVPVTAEPDTSGVLAALGVNSIFQGDDASSIAIRPEVLSNPSLLSVSRSGEAGDTSNLKRFAAIRDAKVLNGNTQSIGNNFLDLVGAIGSEVSQLASQQSAQNSLQSSLEQQELSVSGVDINEEVLNLMSYQRMVESASKYISVVNIALDAVLNMVK
jgi:flagellar hook-associated protein 1